MKINYLFLFVILALSCKEGVKQESLPMVENNIEQPIKKTETATDDLKQNGDYTSLFNSSDCKVITAEEISAALGVTFSDVDNKWVCSFKSESANNKTWNLTISLNEMKKSDIQREIKSFKSDETGLLVLEISETGDTYLCNQHLQGYLSIYNPNYDSSVLIGYGSVGVSRGFSKEERLGHRDLALKLANTLLNKHKK